MRLRGLFGAACAVGFMFSGCTLDSTGIFGGAGGTSTGGSGGTGGMTSTTGGMGGSGGDAGSTSSTGGEAGSTSSTGGAGGMGGSTSSTGGGGNSSSSGGMGGAGGSGGGPADNVTFDTLAMGCFKAVIVDDNTNMVVDGSGSADVCPTELPGIYVPDGPYTLLLWVKDPSSNLASFNTAENFTVSKAVCSTYAGSPTWAQLESDFVNLSYTNIGNAALPPAYLFTKSCPNSAEYRFHK